MVFCQKKNRCGHFSRKKIDPHFLEIRPLLTKSDFLGNTRTDFAGGKIAPFFQIICHLIICQTHLRP